MPFNPISDEAILEHFFSGSETFCSKTREEVLDAVHAIQAASIATSMKTCYSFSWDDDTKRATYSFGGNPVMLQLPNFALGKQVSLMLEDARAAGYRQALDHIQVKLMAFAVNLKQ